METNTSVCFSIWEILQLLGMTIALCAASFPLFSQANQAGRTLSSSGFVRDAQNHTAMDRVEVELCAVAGGTIGRAFTNNGSSRFDNIGAGSTT
jgi:hypothetical protein